MLYVVGLIKCVFARCWFCFNWVVWEAKTKAGSLAALFILELFIVDYGIELLGVYAILGCPRVNWRSTALHSEDS